MSAKQYITDAAEAFLAQAKGGDDNWIYDPLDQLIATLVDWRDAARLDRVRENAGAIPFLAPEGWNPGSDVVEEAPAPAPVAEAQPEPVAEAKPAKKSKVAAAPAADAPAADAPAVDAPAADAPAVDAPSADNSNNQ